MNASGFSRFCKGAVHDTKHLAGSVARVFKASFGLGFLAMPRSREVGSCASQQRGTLFCLRFLGRYASEPSLPKFFFGGLGSNVLSRDGVQFKVPAAVMLLSRQALKVFNAVVQLVSVDVVNVLLGGKTLKPTHSYGSVKPHSSSKGGVTIGANYGQVRVSVPQGFPASRDSVQVVHGSVLDAVYKYA
jgi:hypothetical protein